MPGRAAAAVSGHTGSPPSAMTGSARPSLGTRMVARALGGTSASSS